ncbi:hypothetical protein E2562_014355 [Oryza meyeriana var. granulata]|uniref:Uncharacterized protein n=1 Tax=Oryza meyeriana var. granulata TaxID=110450 RepID=A0A6G1C6F6_9ORYZ|nr:hypothetical protein E2562_014355 [Oryza meyeriana var. granulata]
MFDKEISSEDGVGVLEEVGRLAVKCTSELVHERPTMKQVAEYLEILWRRLKKHLAEGARAATGCTEAEAEAASADGKGTELDGPLSTDIRDCT